MKKILCCAMSAAIMLGSGVVTASVGESDASYVASQMNNMVLISGSITQTEALENDTLTLVVRNGANQLVHIDEINVDGYGRYNYAFELENAENCKVSLRAGGRDVSSSLITAGNFTGLVNATTVAGDNFIEVGTELVNRYCLDNYVLVAVGYDSNGAVSDTEIAYAKDLSNDTYIREFFRLENAKTAKLFAWKNMESITPMGNAKDKFEEPNNEAFSYKRIEAETLNRNKSFNCNSEHFGIGNTEWDYHTSYLCYEDIDLTGVKSIQAFVSANRDNEFLEVRANDPYSGTLVGRIPLKNSGRTSTGEDFCYTASLAAIDTSQLTDKVCDLYIVAPFKSEFNYILEHFILSSAEVPSSDENLKPYYINNDDEKLVYNGEWTETENSSDFNQGEDVKTSAESGASVEYRFFGTGIDYITDLFPNGGEVKISIDGTLEKTLSLQSSTEVYNRTVFTKTGLAKKWHTIKIERVSGEIRIDAFKVYQKPIIIVCVGDSITDGVCANKYIYSYPAQLQRRLGEGYYVIDCGHNGSTTAAILNYGEGRTAVATDADIYINALGTNDGALTDNEDGFKANYMNVMNTLKASSSVSPRIYAALAPIGLESDQESRMKRWDYIRDLALENNWPVIDFESIMSEYQVKNDEPIKTDYYQDACHPTQKGYSIMAQAAAMMLPCPELFDSPAFETERDRLEGLTLDQLKVDLLNN